MPLLDGSTAAADRVLAREERREVGMLWYGESSGGDGATRCGLTIVMAGRRLVGEASGEGAMAAGGSVQKERGGAQAHADPAQGWKQRWPTVTVDGESGAGRVPVQLEKIA